MKRRERGEEPRPVLPKLAEADERVPRRLRVQRDLHERLALEFAQLADPRLAKVQVTRVEMTDDLQLARVYVRTALGGGDGVDPPHNLMRALEAAGGRLRRQVGRHIALRYTPKLRFFYDTGPDASSRVHQLLDEIHRDEHARVSEAGADPISCDDEWSSKAE